MKAFSHNRAAASTLTQNIPNPWTNFSKSCKPTLSHARNSRLLRVRYAFSKKHTLLRRMANARNIRRFIYPNQPPVDNQKHSPKNPANLLYCALNILCNLTKHAKNLNSKHHLSNVKRFSPWQWFPFVSFLKWMEKSARYCTQVFGHKGSSDACSRYLYEPMSVLHSPSTLPRQPVLMKIERNF